MRGLLLVVAALALAGCGAPAENDATPVSSPTPPAAGGTRGVGIVDDAFAPATVTVNAGGTVTWTNRGGPHTVTFSALPVDHVFSAGESFSARFDAVGTYAYVCKFHNDMRGTVNVVAADAVVNESADAPTIVLDEGHYDERAIEVRNGTPVAWQNPRDEDVTVEFRDREETLLVPAGGSASLVLPAGEHWWRELDEGEEWRAGDHEVGIVRVS
jgi:plastocyanin